MPLSLSAIFAAQQTLHGLLNDSRPDVDFANQASMSPPLTLPAKKLSVVRIFSTPHCTHVSYTALSLTHHLFASIAFVAKPGGLASHLS